MNIFFFNTNTYDLSAKCHKNNGIQLLTLQITTHQSCFVKFLRDQILKVKHCEIFLISSGILYLTYIRHCK